jgi:glutamate dehydrogenase (NAD(P)+)
MLADVPRPAFHIDAVTSCADALVRLGRGGVDVVLLDLMLPDGRGLMVFEQIRRAAPEALILVLSASADEDCAQAAVRAGADDYLIKGHVDATGCRRRWTTCWVARRPGRPCGVAKPVFGR